MALWLSKMCHDTFSVRGHTYFIITYLLEKGHLLVVKMSTITVIFKKVVLIKLRAFFPCPSPATAFHRGGGNVKYRDTNGHLYQRAVI